jgi:hypothetical protein
MLWKPYQPRPPPLIYFHSRTREDHEAPRRKASMSPEEALQRLRGPDGAAINESPWSQWSFGFLP